MPTLRIKLSDHREITHELVADRVTVGRLPDNTIQIIDRSVSAHHAELIADDGHYRLHDLGSTNLSFVDGTPVTDFHLHKECRITFGSIQCEFRPGSDSGLPRLSMSQMEKDLIFLRGENADLLGQIVALQRQIDILSSARLVTKKADNTPLAATNATIKSIVSERDDLRHLAAGLKLELEKLREELATTVRERDANQKACELLQAENVTRSRELRQPRSNGAPGVDHASNGNAPTPAADPSAGDTATVGVVVATAASQTTLAQRSNAIAAQPNVTLLKSAELSVEATTTQKITLPLPPAFQAIATPLKALTSALNRLKSNLSEKSARAQLVTQGNKLAQTASVLGGHPIARLSLAIEGLLQECVGRPNCPTPPQIQTLLRATDLVSSLLDPRHHDQGKALPHPKVLAVDEDSDLLHTLAASLELAQLPTTTCSNSQEALTLIEKEDYDLFLVNVGTLGGKAPTLCDRIRENSRYRKTPIIFLPTANTPDHAPEASLKGGNDFLPKPFNSAELTVKAETWIWKNRFGLL